jgi:flagellar biosynthesis/type III secretory pathway protein FliH
MVQGAEVMSFQSYLKEEVERFSPRFDRILYDFAEVKDIQKILRYLEEAYNKGLKEGYQQGRERDYDI